MAGAVADERHGTTGKRTLPGAAPAADEKPLRKQIGLVAILGSLAIVGPLSIDMYLPGFPSIQQDLATSASLVQLTLSACLLGLASGQLIAGPISDVVGRRPPVMVGLVGFVICSLLCSLAPNIETLILLRFLQGLFGSAGVVISRAVIRDLFSGIRAAQMFSLMTLAIGVGPILAPTLGGAILLVTDWRGVFGALVGLGLLQLFVAWRTLPETNVAEHRSTAGVRSTVGAFGSLLRDRAFVGYAVIMGTGMGTMFANVAGSSFVLQNLYGVSEQVFAVLFGVIAVGYIAMSQVNSRLITMAPMRQILAVGLAINLAGALTVLTIVNVLDLGAAGLVIGLFLVATSNGLIAPNVTTLALNDYPRAAGSASALLGLMTFAVGAVVAPLVGIAGEDTAVPLSLAILTCSAIACTAFVTLARSSGARRVSD
ncbi:MAG TPA: multidrug effflux MFS transporter [Thermomicrobiales bacterium]|jgi:DHA1 family bicyclomycin/chloramphenicol resistance-like MFS transporter|nr:multidrug effflux MFS transporter [Thermomicrobiales bacterium]